MRQRRGIGRIGGVVAILDRTLRKCITLRERDIWVKTQMKAGCLPADFWDKTAYGRRCRTCVDSGTSMGLTEELLEGGEGLLGKHPFTLGSYPVEPNGSLLCALPRLPLPRWTSVRKPSSRSSHLWVSLCLSVTEIVGEIWLFLPACSEECDTPWECAEMKQSPWRFLAMKCFLPLRHGLEYKEDSYEGGWVYSPERAENHACQANKGSEDRTRAKAWPKTETHCSEMMV